MMYVKMLKNYTFIYLVVLLIILLYQVYFDNIFYCNLFDVNLYFIRNLTLVFSSSKIV